MLRKTGWIFLMTLVALLAGCTSSTSPVPSAAAPVVTTAALRPTQTPLPATGVAAPTQTGSPTPAITWPRTKITVDNIDSLRLLHSWGQGRADQLFRSPDQAYVVVSGAGLVSVYQAQPSSLLYRLTDVQGLAVSFASNVLVATYQGQPGKETPVKIYDLKSGAVRAEVSHKLDRYLLYVSDDLQKARDAGYPDVTAIAVSPDGASLAVGFGDGRLDVWNIAGAPSKIATQAYTDGKLQFIIFSPSGKSLLVDNQFYQFPAMKLAKVWKEAGVGPVMPDGKSIFMFSGIDLLRVDLETGAELTRTPLDMRITRLGMTPEGKKLLVYTDRSEGSQDIFQFYRRILSLPDLAVLEPETPVVGWDAYTDPDAQLPLSGWGHIPALQGVNIADGKLVAWGQYGSLPFWWFPLDGRVATIPVPDGTALGFHYQDQTIVSCAKDSVSIWQADQTRKTSSIQGLNRCDHVLMNHTGKLIALAAGPDIALVNLATAGVRFLPESNQQIASLAFSDDDSLLTAGTVADYQVHANLFFWNGTVGYPISKAIFPDDDVKQSKNPGDKLLKQDAADLHDVLVSADNTIAASFTENIRIWDIPTGKQLGLIPYDDRASTKTGAISPDKTLLILGDWNGQLHFWDLQKMAAISVQLPQYYKAHRGAVNAIAFNQDGTAFLTAGQDGIVDLWGIP